MTVTEVENEIESGEEQLILPIFEKYQKARLQFAQSIADVALKENANVALKTAGAIPMLCPLIMDVMPTIQRTALMALGRLAANNAEVAEEIVRRNVLPLLVERLKKQSIGTGDAPNSEQLFKRAATFVLRSIAKHNDSLANAVIKTNGLEVVQICLNDSDPLVKESAIMTMANLAKHSEEGANEVISEKYGLIPVLLQSLPEYDLPILRVTVSAIFEISKHSFQLVKLLNENDIVPLLERLLEYDDPQLKSIVISLITQLSRYDENFAFKIASETHSIQASIDHLTEENINSRKNGAIYLLECIKHSDELAQKVIDKGGLPKIVEYVHKHEEEFRIPGLMCLCALAKMDDIMANAIIEEKAIEILCIVLESDPMEESKEIALKTLGYLGNYNVQTTKNITKTDSIILVASLARNSDISSELKSKCNKALKLLLKYCMHFKTLEKIIDIVQDDILEIVLLQFAKILRIDGKFRRRFIISGIFKKVEEMNFPSESMAKIAVRSINLCFPPDVIRYYSTGYLEELLLKVENFEPPSEVASEISTSRQDNVLSKASSVNGKKLEDD